MTIAHVYKKPAILTEYNVITQCKAKSYKIKKRANSKISFVEFILDN